MSTHFDRDQLAELDRRLFGLSSTVGLVRYTLDEDDTLLGGRMADVLRTRLAMFAAHIDALLTRMGPAHSSLSADLPPSGRETPQ